MGFYFGLLFVVLLRTARCQQQQQPTDMGDCACVCGLQSNGGVFTQNGLAPVKNFLICHIFAALFQELKSYAISSVLF